MSVTLLVSQLLMFWLKRLAKANMFDIFVTLPVFQLLMFWLKTLAP